MWLASALSKIEETHLFGCSGAKGVSPPTPQEWKPVSSWLIRFNNGVFVLQCLVSTWKWMNVFACDFLTAFIFAP
jgi:hypothetical protein